MAKSSDAGDDEDELFQVINVTVMSSPDAADAKGLYAAETENLDPVSNISHQVRASYYKSEVSK